MRYTAIKGALDYANKVVFLSKKFKPDFNLIGISPPMSKLEYIGNPSTYKASKEIPPKEKIILMVGRFESLKNQDMVINIWKKIAHNYPDWNLYLAGDGDKLTIAECVQAIVTKLNSWVNVILKNTMKRQAYFAWQATMKAGQWSSLKQ